MRAGTISSPCRCPYTLDPKITGGRVPLAIVKMPLPAPCSTLYADGPLDAHHAWLCARFAAVQAVGRHDSGKLCAVDRVLGWVATLKVATIERWLIAVHRTHIDTGARLSSSRYPGEADRGANTTNFGNPAAARRVMRWQGVCGNPPTIDIQA